MRVPYICRMITARAGADEMSRSSFGTSLATCRIGDHLSQELRGPRSRGERFADVLGQPDHIQ